MSKFSTKLTTKQQVQVEGKNVKPKVFKNGLWADFNLFRNLKLEFTLCRKNGLVLSNKSFDDLNPQQTISQPLMKYLLNSLPHITYHIAIISESDIVDWKLSRKRKNEFVAICSETGWALLIINHNDKSFGFIDIHLLLCGLAEKFITFLQAQKYMHLQDIQSNSVNTVDSGIYIYKHIVELSNGATIPKDFCPATYRIQLQQKIIKESDNLTNFCPICNLSDIEGTPMVECTVCLRWSHCVCIKVNYIDVQKDNDFKCPICTVINL